MDVYSRSSVESSLEIMKLERKLREWFNEIDTDSFDLGAHYKALEALLNDETCTDNLPHQTVIPDQPAYSKLHKFVKTNKRDRTSLLNLCDVLIAFKSKVDLSNKRESEYL